MMAHVDSGVEDEARQATLAYFARVESMLADEAFKEDEEQRELFINNVLAEVDGNELRLLSDLVCSRVLEQLVQV